jgi:EAL domain-containing protein (putative c-di-GMP-specific phosphodiesterase class I)
VIVDGQELRVTGSIGVRHLDPGLPLDIEQLLRQADQAMYEAKRGGKNRIVVFNDQREQAQSVREQCCQEIARAVARNELVLHYQPKVHLRSGALIGLEALVRWRHPQRGLLAPGAFLPLVQQRPEAVAIDRWVLREGLAQLQRWAEAGRILPLSINIDGATLLHPGFIDELRAALAQHPAVPPQALTLEVLESSALQDIERAAQLIRACRAMGVTVSLDDFGTGYATLSYLKRLRVQEVKIDQSFVRDMLEDPDDLAILEGVLGMARGFRCTAVAEGVETPAHGRMLLQLGIELGQGYGIARPMPADAVADWLAHWQPLPAWRRTEALPPARLPLLYAAVDHRAWVKRLLATLDDPFLPPPPLDERECRLGEWLQRWQPLPSDQPHVARLHELHALAHTLGRTLWESLRSEGPASARRHVAALTAVRDELLALLDRLASHDTPPAAQS